MDYTFRTAVESFLTYVGDYSGRLSDENGWSPQSIVHKLLESRTMAIMRAKKEFGEISQSMRQVIDCIEMIEVDQVECPCAPPSGCMWLKSKNPIPNPIILDFVSDVKGDSVFTKTTWDQVKYIKHSRIRSKRTRRHYLLRESNGGDVYLYVLNDKFTPAFTMRGVFYNPIDVARFEECDKDVSEAKCSPLDVKFSTDLNLRDEVFRLTYASIVPLKYQAPTDDLNNDKINKNSYDKPT